jgi:hypothetical protein
MHGRYGIITPSPPMATLDFLRRQTGLDLSLMHGLRSCVPNGSTRLTTA